MKKTLSTILASALMLGAVNSLSAEPIKLNPAEIEKIKKDYPQMLGNSNTEIKKAYNQGDFKQLQVKVTFQTPRGPQSQKFDVFLANGSKTVFAGNAYKPTGEKYDLPIDASVIEKGVAFTVGKGKEVVYLVTDPECPFCQRLETSMPANIGDKYTIKVIPIPLPMHPNAKDIIAWALSGKTNDVIAKRMHDAMTGSKEWQSFSPTPEEKAKYDEKINDYLDAASELNANGTPMVFNSKYEKIDTGVLVNSK